MGSYGIGPSPPRRRADRGQRTTRHGIIWPDAVAPFNVALLNLKVGDAATDAACEHDLPRLPPRGVDVLYDDRDERPGAKFATADLSACPGRSWSAPRASPKARSS